MLQGFNKSRSVELFLRKSSQP